MRRALATLFVALLAFLVLVEVFVRSPVAAAVLVAAGLALFDYWRRRGRLW